MEKANSKSHITIARKKKDNNKLATISEVYNENHHVPKTLFVYFQPSTLKMVGLAIGHTKLTDRVLPSQYKTLDCTNKTNSRNTNIEGRTDWHDNTNDSVDDTSQMGVCIK
jgi:hypothetical protein